MNKKCIVICGGGGKTSLYHKYPNQFLDIDDFIWNSTSNNITNDLKNSFENSDINNISKIYQNIMKNNQELRNSNKIILVHHVENAILLNRTILGILRPVQELHEINIKDRNEFHKNLSRDDWNSLTIFKPKEYQNYQEFENIIFELL